MEIYKGVVYGHSDMRGILSFNAEQRFIRHYVQNERSPRIGQVLWMKGFLVTTTGNQGGFVSPFFMERIPEDPFREQFTFDGEDASRLKAGPASFLMEHVCDVAPIELIIERVRALERHAQLHRSTLSVKDKYPRAVDFVRDFISHAELHFHQMNEQSRYSFDRLAPPQADAPWMAKLMESQIPQPSDAP